MMKQQDLWNNLQQADLHSGEPSSFVKEVICYIPPESKILELGCGAGNDSIGFAKSGYTVVATDFAEVAVKNNSKSFQNINNLSFQLLDISKPTAFSDNEFDVVYARLSLHYFPDEITKKIFKEVYRILKPNGFFCFICKSINDPLYGKGVEIERDMYEREGHIRHFFSEEYAKLLMNGLFVTEKIESGRDIFFSRDSAYVKVIAQAIK